MSKIWLLILFIHSVLSRTASPAKNGWKVYAKKGQFFVQYLHSSRFFNDTSQKRPAYYPVVKWSATLKGRPELPQWLHLLHSRHKEVAYLIGTPVTSANQTVVDIIVRNENNFQHAQKYLVIVLSSNGTHSSSTKKIAELHIKNYDPEDFMHYNGQTLIKQLIASIHAFCKDNTTYIFNLLPAVTAPPEKLISMGQQKFGTVVQIGTQNKEFYPKIENLAKGIQINPQHCKRTGAYQRDFLPTFEVDWCKFKVERLTPLHSDLKNLKKLTTTTELTTVESSTTTVTATDNHPLTANDDLSVITRSSWDSFLMFPMLGVMCILFLILLSMVFFGRREGQYWRDYKTPKEQLEEYVNVRESQQHLRDLSLHRQILEPPSDRDHCATPLGIHSFLQPLPLSSTLQPQNDMQNSVISASSREGKTAEVGEHTSIGKQTVAEAAKACGSSLHMYRNPFDQESNEEEEELEEESEKTNEERIIALGVDQ